MTKLGLWRPLQAADCLGVSLQALLQYAKFSSQESHFELYIQLSYILSLCSVISSFGMSLLTYLLVHFSAGYFFYGRICFILMDVWCVAFLSA